MTGLDDTLRPAAVAMLAKLGASATLEWLTTPSSGGFSPVSSPVSSSVIKASPPAPVTSDQIDGTLVKAEHSTTIVAAQGAPRVPLTGDWITFGSVKYSIVKVDTLNSGDLAAAYQLFIEA